MFIFSLTWWFGLIFGVFVGLYLNERYKNAISLSLYTMKKVFLNTFNKDN